MKKEEKKNGMAVPVCFLITIALLFGGFYDFVSCLATVGLGIYLLWLGKRRGLSVYWNSALMLASVIVAGYLLSVIWAVDCGMAWIGVIKFLPLPLFVIVLMQFREEERQSLLWSVPISNLLIIGTAVLGYGIPVIREHLYLAGRLAGTFQYANTMALYFLLGILILEEKTDFSCRTALAIGVQLLGIFLTGSRTVFVLTIVVLIGYAWRKKKFRVWNLGILGAGMIGGILYAGITSDFQNLGRFLTMSFESSTFLGRLLYWQDALPLILKHPFGLGYMGYFYSQGQIQTGVYSVVYAHNELLQILLDIGWFPAVFAVGIFLKNLLGKGVDTFSKIILAVIVVHSLFDFDFQFLSVGFLFFMMFPYERSTKQEARKLKADGRGLLLFYGVSGVCIAVSLYFFVPLLTFYVGEYEMAAKIYPYYTEAEYILLEQAASKEEGEELSDSILSRNATVSLAYDAKALASAMEGKFEEMIEYKEKAIQYNPYSIREYVDYVSLLSRGIESGEKKELCVETLLEIPNRLKELKNRTSRLGWKIKDRPETELPEEIQAYILQFQ